MILYQLEILLAWSFYAQSFAVLCSSDYTYRVWKDWPRPKTRDLSLWPHCFVPISMIGATCCSPVPCHFPNVWNTLIKKVSKVWVCPIIPYGLTPSSEVHKVNPCWADSNLWSLPHISPSTSKYISLFAEVYTVQFFISFLEATYIIIINTIYMHVKYIHFWKSPNIENQETV